MLASFLVPSFVKRWARIAFRVTSGGFDELNRPTGPNVTLFYNCIEYGTVPSGSWSNNAPLVFDTASTLYIGQAGNLISGEFLVTFVSSVPLPIVRWRKALSLRTHTSGIRNSVICLHIFSSPHMDDIFTNEPKSLHLMCPLLTLYVQYVARPCPAGVCQCI